MVVVCNLGARKSKRGVEGMWMCCRRGASWRKENTAEEEEEGEEGIWRQFLAIVRAAILAGLCRDEWIDG